MKHLPIGAVFSLAFLFFACGGPMKTPGPQTAPAGDESPTETASSEIVPDAAPVEHVEWLAVLVEGHKSGYLKSVRRIFSDRVETEVTTDMEMRRADAVIPIRTVSVMTETPDGKPLRIEKRTEGAGMSRVEIGVLGADGLLHLTTEAEGRRSTRTVEWPSGALMNEGQRLEALRHGLKPGTEYSSVYFDPDLLEAIQVSVRVGEKIATDLLGRTVVGTAVTVVMHVRGTETILETVVDDEMNTFLARSTQMGLSVEMVACTEAFALSRNDPAEIIDAAFVQSPKPLSEKRRERPLTYTLRLVDEAQNRSIVATDEQTVRSQGETVVVTVTKGAPSQKERFPYDGSDADALAALTADTWIQSDDPEILSAAKTAVGDATDTWSAAKNIERFAATYIADKNFSVGYASALETLHSRQGDCTEHALLTAALCRAVGIPAQVVFGLVYVPEFNGKKNLFGGHAWTRVFVDGRWWSLDAALGAFDTGHLALAVSGGDPADFFQIINLIGNIEIVEVK